MFGYTSYKRWPTICSGLAKPLVILPKGILISHSTRISKSSSAFSNNYNLPSSNFFSPIEAEFSACTLFYRLLLCPPIPLLCLYKSCSVVSDSLQPHGLQHARLPCPSPYPRVCSNSCSLSQWCHPLLSPSLPEYSGYSPTNIQLRGQTFQGRLQFSTPFHITLIWLSFLCTHKMAWTYIFVSLKSLK